MDYLNSLVHVVDEASQAESLRSLLQGIGLSAAVHTSAEEFLAAYVPDSAGCLVLDAHLPGMDGLELQLLLRERDIPLPMVFLSGKPDLELAVLAMKRGAADFLVKPFSNRTLFESIRAALDRNTRERSHRETRRQAASRLACLTARERDVLALLMGGRSNKIIAAELGLSPKTVEFHRGRIMMKTRAESLAELIQVAVASGIALPRGAQTTPRPLPQAVASFA